MYESDNGNASVAVQDENTLEITSLGVDEEAQSSGEGTDLVNRVKADADRQNRNVVVTPEASSVDFYTKNGFKPVEGSDHLIYEARDPVLDNDPDTDLQAEREQFSTVRGETVTQRIANPPTEGSTPSAPSTPITGQNAEKEGDFGHG